MTANTTEKTKPFSVYLTESERQDLDAWADREGRSSTAQARIAIREALARGADDGVCQGMGKVLLKAGRYAQHLCFILPRKRNHLYHCGTSLCQRSGLIEYDRIRSAYPFQISTALHGDLLSSGFSHS